jgi:uncharacterized protein (TIGR02594 family)
MVRLLLAVIVALCAFASPSLAASSKAHRLHEAGAARHHVVSHRRHAVRHHVRRGKAHHARSRHHVRGKHALRGRHVGVHRPRHHSRRHLRGHHVENRRSAVRQARRATPVLQEGRASLSTRTSGPEVVKAIPGPNARAVALAERYIGTNPTGRRSLWCANFLGMIEKKAGRRGTGSNLARSYASYGHRVAQPKVGDIAVLARKGGGHVGYFVGWDKSGRAILISGNSRGGKVSKGTYSAGRVIAWRRPA